MELVECKACHANISKRAKACPQCGEPQRRLSIVTKVALAVLLVAVAFGSIDKKMAATAPPQVKQFSEGDFHFTKDMLPYREIIVRTVNMIARDDPRCRNTLDPVAAGLSGSRSKPGKPVFYVPCGDDAKAMVNVYFDANGVFQK